MKALRLFLVGIFVVASLAYLNIVIPQPQQVKAITENQVNGGLAQVWTGIPDGQGGTFTMHIGGEEHPDCSTGSVNNLSSYAGGFNMFTRDTNKTIHVTFASQSYYCQFENQTVEGHKCKVNPTGLQTVNHDLVPGEYLQWQPNTVQMNSCGLTQWDMSFQIKDINGNVVYTAGDMNQPGISDQAYWTYCFASINGQHNWCSTTTPTPTASPTPIPPTPTPTPGPQNHLACQGFACVRKPGPPQPGETSCTTASGTGVSFECSHFGCLNNSCELMPFPGQNTCTTQPDSCTSEHHNVCQNNACVQVAGPGNDSCRLNSSDCTPPHLTVIKIVNNNHGGTKSSADFSIHVKNGDGDVAGSPAAGSSTGTTYTLNAGDYTVAEDAVNGYHQVSISGSCDANGNVTLINGDNKTCIIQNEDNGSGSCTMPTCNTSISGCSYPYPDTNTCSCGPLVCITNTPSQNITVNVTQSQSQQQQAVLGASVAPASTPSQLPSTGAGADILLTLVGLLPVGFKLRKLV